MNFLEKYNIKFNDPKLLETALTHSSYVNENGGENYERLEFLGDAVLEIIISEYLYLNLNLQEGGLSKLRASYVCEQALVKYAQDIDLPSHIKLGKGQSTESNEAIIADVFESVMAAIYLDQGIDKVKKLVYAVIIPYIKKKTVFLKDAKSALQEMVQTTKGCLEYVVIKEKGPAHNRKYTIEVRVDGIVYGIGFGNSKKEAEQMAALDAINKRAK
ncbi:MAG TPA: ribonuclease III [Bacilli bacterium]|nr:ribonuclease III [Bacilli bacterium]